MLVILDNLGIQGGVLEGGVLTRAPSRNKVVRHFPALTRRNARGWFLAGSESLAIGRFMVGAGSYGGLGSYS